VKRPLIPLVLPLLLVPMNLSFAAGNANDLVKQSIQKWGLQTEIPNQAVEPPSDPLQFHLSPEVLRFLLWSAVIVGVAVILWSLRDNLPIFSRSRKITAPAGVPASAAQSSRLDAAQVEADDLARQGHFGEAMHVLLLKSLDELRRQLKISFAVSLTSREILRRVQLSEVGRRALADIILAVEQVYFGGRAVGASDYSDCRNKFDVLKHSLAAVVA
jgi:hypothetical protein